MRSLRRYASIVAVIFLFPILAYATPIEQLQNNHLLGNTFVQDSIGRLYIIYKKCLYVKNNDRGDNWNRIVTDIATAAIDPKNSNIFYVVTINNSVRKSMDAGKKWIDINNGLPSNMKIRRIFINPHDNEEIYLASDQGLYKTSDAGFRWEQAKLKDDVRQFIINPKDRAIQYARTTTGLSYSTDEGQTWNKMDLNLPKKLVKGKGRSAQKVPLQTFFIAFANHSTPFLIASVAEIIEEGKNKSYIKSRLFKTTDNGATWSEAKISFDFQVSKPTSYYVTDDRIFIGSSKTIYQSTDGINYDEINLSNNNFREGDFSDITGIYKLPDDKGLIINDATEKIIYVDNEKNMIGLNYGVMAHSKILAMENGLINNINNSEGIFQIQTTYEKKGEQTERLSVNKIDGKYYITALE